MGPDEMGPTPRSPLIRDTLVQCYWICGECFKKDGPDPIKESEAHSRPSQEAPAPAQPTKEEEAPPRRVSSSARRRLRILTRLPP